MTNSTPEISKRIVYYDGECGFCNKTVLFVLRNRKKDFYFIPLQSSEAIKRLSEENIRIDLSSLYYSRESKVYSKSTAVLKIAKDLKFPFPILSYFAWIIPRFLRDFVYDKTAKNRNRLSGEFCVIPTAEEKKFFL